MFGPPPGYVDCEADADIDRPHLTPGPYRVLEVPGVGVIHARRPLASAVAAVAGAANPRTKDQSRNDWLHRFLNTHLQPGELDSMLVEMIVNDLPADTIMRVARVIATADTARSYSAVINLSLIASHGWRDVRAKLHTYGIADAMTLPSLHHLLDAVESMVVESTVSGAKTQSEGQKKLDRLHAQLYRPDVAIDGAPETIDGEIAPPPGFEPVEIEAAFDAFAAVANLPG